MKITFRLWIQMVAEIMSHRTPVVWCRRTSPWQPIFPSNLHNWLRGQ